MYFIILTTAFTLNRDGQTNIETSRDAALALRPLAGPLASTLYTIGIVGVGLLAIPTLTWFGCLRLRGSFGLAARTGQAAEAGAFVLHSHTRFDRRGGHHGFHGHQPG